MFHRAFFNSIIDKHQHMHSFTFNTVLVQRTAPQGSPRTPATYIAATTPGLIVRILKFCF